MNFLQTHINVRKNIGVVIATLLLLSTLGGAAVYVIKTHVLAVAEVSEVNTLHVYPSAIESRDFANIEALRFQDVSEEGLLGDFNTYNSAYVGVEVKRTFVPVEEIIEEQKTKPTETATTTSEVDDVVLEEIIASTTPADAEETITETPSPDDTGTSEDVEAVIEASTTPATSPEPVEETAAPEEVVEGATTTEAVQNAEESLPEEEQAVEEAEEAATTTSGIRGFIARLFTTRARADESNTSTTTPEEAEVLAGSESNPSVEAEETASTSVPVLATTTEPLYATTSKAADEATTEEETPLEESVVTQEVVVDEVAPTLEVVGKNPARIAIGATYNDLGANITSWEDQNLGIHYEVNGEAVDTVSIDTSTSSVHRIIYSVTDNAGNVGYVERVVVVGDAFYSASSEAEVVADKIQKTSFCREGRTCERRVIQFGDFGISGFADGAEITNAQLRLSFAGTPNKREENIQEGVLVEYLHEGVWEAAGSIALTEEISNALNGGYFLFALPVFQNLSAFDELQVRLVYESEQVDLSRIFVDALWVEIETETAVDGDDEVVIEESVVEYVEGLEKPKHADVLSSSKLHFNVDELPTFDLRYYSQRNGLVNAVRGLFSDELYVVTKTKIEHMTTGEIPHHVEVVYGADNNISLRFTETPTKLRPGKYIVTYTVKEGKKEFVDTFEFYWGVLVVNPTKSIYVPNETATLHAAALTDRGNTICDANLLLHITDPTGTTTTQAFEQSGFCKGNNVTNVPDYTLMYKVGGVGTYTLRLSLLDEEGEEKYFVTDKFEVENSVPFIVERTEPSRIFPLAPYTTSISIRANEKFVGSIVEMVPTGFVVTNTNADIQFGEEFTKLIWDASLQVGDEMTLSYTFDAPDISPFIYTTGPLQFVDPLVAVVEVTSSGAASSTALKETIDSLPQELSFGELISNIFTTKAQAQEKPTVLFGTEGSVSRYHDARRDVQKSGSVFTESRAWKIASDAAGHALILWDNDSYIPSGWSCVSCNSGDDYYQRFLRGSSTAATSTSFGNPTHTHTVSADVNAAGVAGTGVSNGSGNTIIANHIHSITETVSSTTTLPRYRQLQILRQDTVGDIIELPAGAILLFDSAVPAGWTQYSNQNNYFIRGEGTSGTIGGQNTHTHSISATIGAASGATYGSGGNTSARATAAHTHTVSATTSQSVDHRPPYIGVILASINATTSSPGQGFLAMFDGTIPGGWLTASGNGDDFNGRFLVGSTTYGVTGGATAHTHTDITGEPTTGQSATVNTNNGSGAIGPHSHTVDYINFSSENNLPPYADVVIAKRVGLNPVFTQNAYRWYVNENAEPPTNIWPETGTDLAENEAITTDTTTVGYFDVIRLRMNVGVTNATSTVGLNSYKLQYGLGSVCTAISDWNDVGQLASSTPWIGYNNLGIDDDTTLSSTTLSASTVFGSYEEVNNSTSTPVEVGIGDYVEYDWVLRNNTATSGVSYCFRMVESNGDAFAFYTNYPKLFTNSSPDAPEPSTLFDNEEMASSTPWFEFKSFDSEGEPLHYQIQVDEEVNFSSTIIDATTENDEPSFRNRISFSNKAPYNNNELIRFTSTTTLTDDQTYWWRVRAIDPDGSNEYSDWSTPRSFTASSTIGISTWFQTTHDQFETNTLDGVEGVSNQAQLVAGSTTGTMTSTPIDFDSATIGNAWGELSWNDTESGGSTVTYQIEYFTSTSSWELIPDSVLSGNSAGFTNSPVVLLSINTETYNLIRIVATLTDAGPNPSIQDWSVSWGSRVSVPTHISLFDNEKTGTTSPSFTFYSTDLDGDALDYQFSYSTDYTFTSSTTVTSGAAGFSNDSTPLDPNPYNSGDTIRYDIQTPLTASTTYWWRVRAKDTDASNSWSFWSTPWSFTTASSTETINVSTWFQDTTEQWQTDTISGFQASGGSVGEAAAGSNTYTFSGITNPSSTHIARDFEIDVQDPTDPQGALDDIDTITTTGASGGTPALRTSIAGYSNDTEASTAEYTALSTSNDSRYITLDPGAGDNAVFMATFNIAEDPANISQIDVTLEGYQNTGTDVAWLGIWNAGTTTPFWKELSHSQQTTDFSYTGTITTDLEEYVDENGDLHIIFFNEDVNDALYIDYVEVDISTIASTEGAITSTPIDFFDGEGPGWDSFSWSDSEPNSSDIKYQIQYLTATSSWSLIPNSDLSGNVAGFDTSPIDISGLDYNTYTNIRLTGDFACDLTPSCPSLHDWTVTWQPGITISGTAQSYDHSTNLTSGTVAVAVNGDLKEGKTGTISGGTWSIPYVTAFAGDVITVFIDGAADSGEAVAVTKYATGTGDITGMKLFERHLSIGSNQNATTTNAELALYDFSTSGNEDLFFDVDAGNDLMATSTGTFDDVVLYIDSGDEFRPDSSSSGDVYIHDMEIDGTVIADANTIYVQGSWTNAGIFEANTGIVIFTATSTTESIDSTGAATSTFNRLTLGQTSGSATWNNDSALDVNGNFTISYGTLSASTSNIYLAGNLTIGANGAFAKGSASTTFDGSVAKTVTDNTASLQDLGDVVVDGTSKTLNLGSNIKLTNLTIGANDTVNVSTSHYDIEVFGDWTNGGTFTAQQGAVVFATTSLGAVIDAGTSAFSDLTFRGLGGGWSFTQNDLSVTNDFTVASGTVTMAAGTTTISGSMSITDTFDHNDGSVLFDTSGSDTINASTSPFYDLYFNSNSGTWAFTSTNATATNDVHIVDGGVTLPSGTLAIGNDFVNSDVFTHNSGTIRFYSNLEDTTVNPGSSRFGSVLFDGSGGWNLPASANVDIDNDITLRAGTATSTGGYLYVGGSWLNSGGVFVPNDGTVVFDSNDTGETIDAGGSSFATTTFDGTTGGWTITAPATSTNKWILTNADTFILASGQSIEVQGEFANSIGGASTTWSGSTLFLNSGTDYGINASTTAGDGYGTLLIGANTDIDMWNSSSTNYIVDTSSSLYSQDHNGVDGDLYIWGDYVRTSGADYWSYATDFDGYNLSGGNERQVNVRFANGASASLQGGSLNIVGGAAATTTINNQGAGNYTVLAGNGTLNARYYSFRNLAATGLVLTNTPTITSLADGDFEVAINGGSAMTIGGTAIDANTELQVERIRFATTTAISAINVTATGTPTSFFWFRNHYGNLDGEDYDVDPGIPSNPGNVRWDDSNISITISGNVYDAIGGAGLGNPPCDGSTKVVVFAVNGVETASTTCAAGTGAYSLAVSFLGDPVITAYLNTNGGARAATITKTPIADVDDFDLYEDYVIVRHEGVNVASIADLAEYDSSNDSDIPFTASTGTPDLLTVAPNTGMYIWPGKTFVPGGNMTFDSGGSGDYQDGTLHAGTSTTLTFANGEEHSFGGSFVMDTTTIFNAASTTLTFTATTTGKIIAATSTLQQVVFNGAGGAWNVASTTTITGDIVLTDGTITGTADITVSGGDITGNGAFSKTGGTLTLEGTGSFGGTNNWTLSSLAFGDGATVATTTKSGAGTVTVSGILTIDTNHILEAGSSDWVLGGGGTPFVINGTFDADQSLFSYRSTSATNITATSYQNLSFAPTSGSPTYTFQAGTVSVNNALTFGNGTNGVTVNADTNDPTITVGGNTTIDRNATFIGSSANTFRAGASWTNDGTFTHSNGTVLFNASTTGHTIAASTSPFFNATFDSATGGWTVSESATSSNNFNLNNASSFTVSPSVTLQVDGQFYNGIASSTTTWTDSRLYLNSGTTYAINIKNYGDDTYNEILVGDGTQVSMWNSTSTVNTIGSGALYSQDHNLVDGDLYIWGDYQKTLGTDYWSFATDFDGTDLTGSERKVDVYLADNATTTIAGGTLNILGTGANTTDIQAQGSGTYAFEVSSGTFSAQYYSIRDIDATGLEFSGTPTVSQLSNGDFLLETTGGSMITVSASVLDANTGKTFSNNVFATSTGVASGANVTATGVSVGSWRFTTYTGNFGGENNDVDPGGDPGYIVWDDSDSQITISGTVYTDEGSSVAGTPTCGAGNQTVHLSVAGAAPITTTCDGSGDYSISGITYNPGDEIAVYLDADNGATFAAATVTVDPLTNITNMDLYQDRVIVRHEDTNPITNANLSICDSSTCDTDIPFDVTGSDLVVDAGTELHIWTNKSFAPGGNVTLHGNAAAEPDGSLHVSINGSFIASGGESHSIAGSFNMLNGASFVSSTSTVTFTATTTGKVISATTSPFHNITFNGSGGAWSFLGGTMRAHNDFTISGGTVTLPNGTTTVAGSFDNTGGAFAHSNGLLYLISTSTGNTIEAGGSDFYNLTFNGSGGSWLSNDTNATTTSDLVILAGSTTLPTGTLSVGGSFRNAGGTFTALSDSTQYFTSSGSENLLANGSDFGSLVFNGSGGSFTMQDYNATSTGDFVIQNGAVGLATGTLAVAESFNNSGGSFTANTSSTVRLYGSGVGETINANGSLFRNLIVDGALGVWTLSGNATTTETFKLLNASDFTASGFVEVQGEFTNLVGGASTTWTGSELFLRSGTNYSINTKSAGGDQYETLLVGSVATSTDIRMWNSTSTIYTTYGTSSIYSQDHNATDGSLYVWGQYERSGGTDYWSYATDFDGTDLTLGSNERQVNVRFASGATTTISGGTLQVVGTAGATTTVANQGSGEFGLHVSSGTLNASYYQLQNMNGLGLNLSSASVSVSSLSYGDLILTKEGGNLITVVSDVVDNNPTLDINYTRFATSSGITSGYNASRDATSTNQWDINFSYGNFDGEANDNDGFTECGSFVWSDSTCLQVAQSHYRLRNDDGGIGVPDNEWFDTDWSKRKRIRITDTAGTTTTNLQVSLDIAYDSDMQSGFEDIRFTDDSGTTTIDYWIEEVIDSDTATVWVEVPSLAASSFADIYLYYGNALATDGGVGTTTFLTFDDFEDNNLSEYSGDASLFETSTGFNYQGTYGVDATAGNLSAQTTDGIYRTTAGSTFGQNSTVRFFQYIDMSTGGNDETCTLFGVQSPGSNNNNYAVCLDPYNTDQITISENVSSDDDSGTILATENVTFTTGWYEVEVDWQYGGIIDVNVYKNGSFFASTTATDISHTSGGFGFSFWGQHGGWDLFTVRRYVSSDPTYTVGLEQGRGGATWKADEDTPYLGQTTEETVRLRFTVKNTGPDIVDQNFKLEASPKTGYAQCESVPQYRYVDVPTNASCTSGNFACMSTSSSVTNLAATTELLSVPNNTSFVAGQFVEDPSTQTGNIDILQNYFTEVEYAFQFTSNATSSAYCLKVTNGGVALDSYSVVAEVGIIQEPMLLSYTLNNSIDIALSPGATTTVYASGTVIDRNGYDDLSYATATIYRSGVGSGCAANDNNCYKVDQSACTFSNCSGNSCDLMCRADIWYHADPTDTGGYIGQDWLAEISVFDDGGYSDTQTTFGVDMLTLRAITSSSTINFGSLSVETDTGDVNATTTVTNDGNDNIDVTLSGTDLTFGASSIGVTNQKYATSTFNYSACAICGTLTGTPTQLEVDLFKPTSTSTPIRDEVYWGIYIPFGTAGAAHEGLNTFTAVPD